MFRIYRLTAVLAVSGMLIGVLSMPAHAKSKTVTFIVRGTASSVPGACTTGYADKCISGTCECVTLSDVTVSGLGRGATAEVSLTLDTGAKTPSPDTAGCDPVFGSVTVSGTTKKGEAVSATLGVSGTLCDPVTSNEKDEIVGGFGIQSGSVGGAALTGFGLVAGTARTDNGLTTLKFSGPVTTTTP